MFPIAKYDTHIERLRMAADPTEGAAGFFCQVQAVYSTECVPHLVEN